MQSLKKIAWQKWFKMSRNIWKVCVTWDKCQHLWLQWASEWGLRFHLLIKQDVRLSSSHPCWRHGVHPRIKGDLCYLFFIFKKQTNKQRNKKSQSAYPVVDYSTPSLHRVRLESNWQNSTLFKPIIFHTCSKSWKRVARTSSLL